MRILMVTPPSQSTNRGNQVTAVRWCRILTELGHHVESTDTWPSGSRTYDCLIALHATHTHPVIQRFSQQLPNARKIVCLTGTDLHVDLNLEGHDSETPPSNYLRALNSLELADDLILLEPRGMQRLPMAFHQKCHVIYQSARPIADPLAPPEDRFLISVIGHLRPVKDPFRTALASQLVPNSSRIEVVQVGMALDEEMQETAERETRTNPRYRWIGPTSHHQAMRWLTNSHVTVINSISEGAPSVISEAVVHGVPVLASRIDASVGLLGRDFPGLFDVGQTAELSTLMQKCELNSAFLASLRDQTVRRRDLFRPDREKDSWSRLLELPGA